MPLVNFLAGPEITADQLNLMQNLQSVIKPSDQSITSSATLTNDNALYLPMVASASYVMFCNLSFKGGTLGSSDIQWQWTGPSGATMRYGADCFAIGGGYDGFSGYMSDVLQSSSNGTSNIRPIKMLGAVQCSTTAGNLQLQWAQVTSSATATTVQAQSFLALLRIS